ncbi:ATPase with role in protein import into the ER [Tulasnella sp. 408]|nr:ATPase with role in protein import into the ER [Tulasnella sp. 408]
MVNQPAAYAYGLDQNKHLHADEAHIPAYDIGERTLKSVTRAGRCAGIWLSPPAPVTLSLPTTNIPSIPYSPITSLNHRNRSILIKKPNFVRTTTPESATSLTPLCGSQNRFKRPFVAFGIARDHVAPSSVYHPANTRLSNLMPNRLNLRRLREHVALLRTAPVLRERPPRPTATLPAYQIECDLFPPPSEMLRVVSDLPIDLLGKMKQTAEACLGEKDTHAVVTRQATKDTRTIARLNILCIVREPTAATSHTVLPKRTPVTLTKFDDRQEFTNLQVQRPMPTTSPFLQIEVTFDVEANRILKSPTLRRPYVAMKAGARTEHASHGSLDGGDFVLILSPNRETRHPEQPPHLTATFPFPFGYLPGQARLAKSILDDASWQRDFLINRHASPPFVPLQIQREIPPQPLENYQTTLITITIAAPQIKRPRIFDIPQLPISSSTLLVQPPAPFNDINGFNPPPFQNGPPLSHAVFPAND